MRTIGQRAERQSLDEQQVDAGRGERAVQALALDRGAQVALNDGGGTLREFRSDVGRDGEVERPEAVPRQRFDPVTRRQVEQPLPVDLRRCGEPIACVGGNARTARRHQQRKFTIVDHRGFIVEARAGRLMLWAEMGRVTEKDAMGV